MNEPPPALPLVSAIITTRARPNLVGRALRSALDQPGVNLEVIVVVDGPDPDTLQALQAWRDPRLRLLPLPERRGANGARNAGIAAASGQWMAMLDDDDEWLPGKLAAQFHAASQSPFALPVVGCQLRVSNGRTHWLRPRRRPTRNEPVGDYLFRRTGFLCEGFVQTSTLFGPRDLFLRSPFDERVRKYQDADWLLRACSLPGAGLEMVMSPLSIWHAETDRPRKSHEPVPVDELLAWIRERRALLSRRAYAGFLLNMTAPLVPPGEWRERWRILREAFASGRPSFWELSMFVFSTMLPPPWRVRLRVGLLSRLKGKPLGAG